LRQKRDDTLPEAAKHCTSSVCDGPYVVGEGGEYRPGLIPTRCPLAPRNSVPCRIGVDHRRPRKTGPEFPLDVLACATHDSRFTLYPLGHVPYGRERVAPVTPSGDAVVTASPKSGTESEAAVAGWANTRFTAVADAATGKLWPRCGPGARRLTQESRVDDVSRLLTVNGGAAAVEAEVSRLTGVAHLVLRDAADALRQAEATVSQAKQLLPLLGKCAEGPGGLQRVLALGARAGLWGPVHLWTCGAVGPFRVLYPGTGMPSG
jgi:hypothetical protein